MSIAEQILVCLETGLIITAFLTSPFGLYKLVGGWIKHSLKKADFEREIKRLQKKGYVALTKTPDGWAVRLLKKGKRRQDRAVLHSIRLKKYSHWDNRWRLFIFDIPEKQRYQRDFIRDKLKELGLCNIQRSVFAYPYDCREELETITDILGISRYTTYAEVIYSDIDKELKKYFQKMI